MIENRRRLSSFKQRTSYPTVSLSWSRTLVLCSNARPCFSQTHAYSMVTVVQKVLSTLRSEIMFSQLSEVLLLLQVILTKYVILNIRVISICICSLFLCLLHFFNVILFPRICISTKVQVEISSIHLAETKVTYDLVAVCLLQSFRFSFTSTFNTKQIITSRNKTCSPTARLYVILVTF